MEEFENVMIYILFVQFHRKMFIFFAFRLNICCSIENAILCVNLIRYDKVKSSSPIKKNMVTLMRVKVVILTFAGI